MIYINFKINKKYLINFLLGNTNNFSCEKYQKDIIKFQNLARERSSTIYKFLTGWALPSDINKRNLDYVSEKLKKYYYDLENKQIFQKLYNQTKKYKKFCKLQREENFKKSYNIIKNLSWFSPKGKYFVYITHPGIKNWQYLWKNQIQWWNKELFENYTTIYLWHEIMHSYFGNSNIEHSIIQFICDEELRIRLNWWKYPPFVGHLELYELMEQMLPYWKKYLRTKNKNIYEFLNNMRGLF